MRLRLAALLLLVFLLPASASARAQASPPLSLNRYWLQLRTTRHAVFLMSGQPAGEVRPRLLQLAVDWEAVTQVETAGGMLVTLDHSRLAALLRADPPDVPKVLACLDGMLAARERFPAGVYSQEDIASLQAILARPEFRWERPASPLQELWDKFWEKLFELLERLFGKRQGSADVSILPVPPWLFPALFLLPVLVYALRGLLSGWISEAGLAEGARAEELLTAETAFERAGALSDGGDYRTAIRYLYLSALLYLDERGLLRYDRSKTNREYLRMVAADPPLARSLRAVVEVFDRVWYGFEPVDQAAYADYLEHVNELRRQRP